MELPEHYERMESILPVAPALSSLVDIFAFYSHYSQVTGRPTNSREGKEWHGSCPRCGGTDRFSFWQSGRFSCSLRASGCGIHGSSPYWFLRDVEGLNHYQACEELGIDPYEFETQPAAVLPLSMTRDEAPCSAWQNAAELFCHRAEKYLWTPGGASALAYLHSRGFSDETLRLARIGFCPDWYSESLESWGLSLLQTQSEEEMKIPRGIILPWIVDHRVWKISIRREDRTYFQCLGSSDCLYNINSLQPNKPVFLTEGEFDALSIQQEIGNIAACIATGSASKGRSSPLSTRLKKAPHLLVAFDQDEAGHAGSQEWLKSFKNAVRWQPWSHDCNEMLQNKMPVKLWAEMGIKAASIELQAPEIQKTEQTPIMILPALQNTSESRPERILTYLELNPWTTTGDRGLPRFCSVCKRAEAVYWGAGITPYCELHWPGTRW